MRFPPLVHLPALVCFCLLFPSGWSDLPTRLVGQDNRPPLDPGSSNPILKLKSRFSDALSAAEKAIPRSQKYQILNQERHRLKSNAQSQGDPRKHLNLAYEYLRFRFPEEAAQLLKDVVEMPSSKDEMLLEAHRALAEIEFVANDNLPAAIRHFEKAVRYAPTDSRSRGELLGRLGSYYLINDQVDEMKKVFTEFNRLPEKVKFGLPDSHLKANLYLGRFTDDPEAAQEFFDEAHRILAEQPDAFDPELVLSVSSEMANSKVWNSPTRIKRLAKLIDEEQFAGQTRLRQVIMEVFFAYFLEREKEWERFDRFVPRAIERLEKTGSQDDRPADPEVQVLICEVVGIHAGAAEQARQKWDRKKSQETYRQSRAKMKQTQLYFPGGMTQEQQQQALDLFAAGHRLLRAPQNQNSDQPEKDSDKKRDQGSDD